MMNQKTKKILEDFIEVNIAKTPTTKSTNMKYTVVAKADELHMNIVFEVTATAMLSHIIAVKNKEVITDTVLCTPISDYDFDTLDFSSNLPELKNLLLQITDNVSEDANWEGKFSQLKLIDNLKAEGADGDLIRALDVIIKQYGNTGKVIEFLNSKEYNGEDLVGNSYNSSDMQDLWFKALTDLKNMLNERDLHASAEATKNYDVSNMNRDGTIGKE